MEQEHVEGRLTRTTLHRHAGAATAVWPALLTAILIGASVVGASPASADTVRSGQWYLGRLGITKAWSVTRGAGVRVAVIDSGVYGRHPDLRGAVVGGADFSGLGSRNGQLPVGSDAGHGTAVGSVLAARGHGSGHRDGVIGVAPAAQLLSASVADGLPNGDEVFSQAVRWSVAHGARVINISYNLSGGQSPLMRAALAFAEAKDVVVVASAGNAGPGTISMPADVPGVVGVSGVDADLRVDPNSSTGKGVAIAAPFSTKRVPAGAFAPTADGGLPVAAPAGLGPYANRVGTSLSAPVVAGVAALIRARYPKLDAANVINRLIKTATPTGGTTPNGSYGYGIVNAYAAVTKQVTPVTANPLGSLDPSAPSTSGAPSTAAGTSPPSSNAPTSSAPPASPPTQSAGSTSSGLGAGAWAGIAAAIAVVLVTGMLIARERRRRTLRGPYNR